MRLNNAFNQLFRRDTHHRSSQTTSSGRISNRRQSQIPFRDNDSHQNTVESANGRNRSSSHLASYVSDEPSAPPSNRFQRTSYYALIESSYELDDEIINTPLSPPPPYSSIQQPAASINPFQHTSRTVIERSYSRSSQIINIPSIPPPPYSFDELPAALSNRFQHASRPVIAEFYGRDGEITNTPSTYSLNEQQASSISRSRGNIYRPDVMPSEASSRQYWTPLMHAMNNPTNTRQVENVVNRFIHQINEIEPSTGHTPLINATINGKIQFVEELLKQGVLPSQPDNKGRTAFAYAAAFGKIEALESLIQHLSPNPQHLAEELNRKDNDGLTPMMLAARNEQPTLNRLISLLDTVFIPPEDIATALDLAKNQLQQRNVPFGAAPYTPENYLIASSNVNLLVGLLQSYNSHR